MLLQREKREIIQLAKRQVLEETKVLILGHMCQFEKQINNMKNILNNKFIETQWERQNNYTKLRKEIKELGHQITGGYKKTIQQEIIKEKIRVDKLLSEKLGNSAKPSATIPEFNPLLVPKFKAPTIPDFKITVPNPSNFANSNSQYYKYFNLQANTIQYNDEMKYTQILGKTLIRYRPQMSFTISKTKRKQILVGIVDEKYITDRSSWHEDRKQCVLYMGEDGRVYDGGAVVKSEPGRFVEGLKIKMKVSGSSICWSFGQQITVSHKNPLIGEPSINWVPVVIMRDKGDNLKFY